MAELRAKYNAVLLAETGLLEPGKTWKAYYAAVRDICAYGWNKEEALGKLLWETRQLVRLNVKVDAEATQEMESTGD